MKIKILLLSFFSFFFLNTAFSVCTNGTVDAAIWGTPDDFEVGFTSDTITTDIDTIQITQGIDTTIFIQYLLPLKQHITSPITGDAIIESIQVLGVTNLPIGMDWVLDATAQANNNTYNPQTYRYGVVSICGSTFASPGLKTINVTIEGCGTLSGFSQCSPASFPIYVEVLPTSSGNLGFSFTPPSGCSNMDVDFETSFESPDTILKPLAYYEWDFNDGTANEIGSTVSNHNYNFPGFYPVKLSAYLYGFYISNVELSNITSASDGWGAGDVDVFGTFETETLNEIANDATPSWNVDIPIIDFDLYCDFSDADVFSDEAMGNYTYTISSNQLYSGNIINYSTGGYDVRITINKKIMDTISFYDTVKVYQYSGASITNLGNQVFCVGDSSTLSLGTNTYDYVQWFKDTEELIGENDNNLIVKESGNYYAEVLGVGTICPGYSNTLVVSVGDLITPIINQSGTSMFVTNTLNNDVQWFANDIAIPLETNDELSTFSGGIQYSVSFTNGYGCLKFSDYYYAYIVSAGTSTQNGNSISTSENVDFTATGFDLCPGQAVAWAVSTQTDGPVTSESELQTSINNGWVYPSTDLNSFAANCSNTEFPAGDYYMTPVSVNAINAVPVYWNANTDSGYCDAKMELCISLTGTDWKVKPLTITTPNGNEIDVLCELVDLCGAAITPGLWNSAATNGQLCIDFIDVLGYYEDPNGTWTITAPNITTVSSGELQFNVDAFNIVVEASSCDSLATDQITPMGALNGTVAQGETGTFTFVVPPTPSNFPQITPNCLLFGNATAFSSSCPVTIEDIIVVDDINLYPNPNNGLFNIEFEVNEQTDIELSIIDITGRTLINREYSNINEKFKETFDLKNNLNTGFYFLDIKIGNEHTQKKFIIK